MNQTLGNKNTARVNVSCYREQPKKKKKKMQRKLWQLLHTLTPS